MLIPGAVCRPLYLCLGARGVCEGSGLALLPTAIHTGLPHHLPPEPGCGGTASTPLLLEGLGPAGHQGGAVEGDHRLARLQSRPRALAAPPASLGL